MRIPETDQAYWGIGLQINQNQEWIYEAVAYTQRHHLLYLLKER